jgi:predicted permease
MRKIFKHEPAPGRIAGDVDDELAFHIQERTEKLIGQGMSPDAARTEALKQFGDMRDVRDSCVTLDRARASEVRRSRRFEELRQDLAYAWRSTRRNPGFALVVILTLALGIGANTAIFTLVDAVLLRKLPVREPDQLFAIGNPTSVGNVSVSDRQRADIMSYPQYRHIRDNARSFSGVLASGRGGRLDVYVGEPNGDPEHPSTRFVSGNYFSVLGVPAFIGRTFEDRDDREGQAPPIAVISHGYWTRRFASEPSAIGRIIRVQGQQLTIVGVTPPGFRGEIVGSSPELWLPITLQPVLNPYQPMLEDMQYQWFLLLARRNDGVTESQATAEMTTMLRNWIDEKTPPRGARSQVPEPVYLASGARGFSWVREEYRVPLFTLMAGVGLVLLMICANIANLLFARAIGRGREMGVRLSLGAGRARLVRQLLTESLLLALFATGTGLLVATWGSRILLLMAGNDDTPVPVDANLSLPVLGFTVLLTILALGLFGLAPALRTSRVDLASVMRAQSRSLASGLGGGPGRLLSGQLLITAQVALSLVLVLGAALLVRSLSRLQNTDTGLDRDRLLVVDVAAQQRGYMDERRDQLLRQVTERVTALTGVKAVSFSENGIFSGTESSTNFFVPGFTARDENDTTAYYDEVGPGYVEAIGGRLIEGRDISDRDVAGSVPVILVNQTMAQFYWPGRSAVGQTIRYHQVSLEVVGVLADTKDHALDSKPVRRFYLAYTQRAIEDPVALRVLVRATDDPALLGNPVAAEIRAIDPELRVRHEPLAVTIRESIAQERMMARLAGGFGVLALLLAAIGLYGLMTFATSRRTGEIGLRMALGAKRGDVVRMVLLEAFKLVGLGLVVGVPFAFAATRLLKNQLFDVPAGDPVSAIVAVAVLTGAAALAALIPALRASRVDPMTALRQE